MAKQKGAKEMSKIKKPKAKPRKMAMVRIPIEDIIEVDENYSGYEAGHCVICGAHGWLGQIKHKKDCDGAKALKV